MRVPSAVLDVVMRMPPLDVLCGLEELEPPVEHAAGAAMKIGAHGHDKATAGQAGNAGFQPQRRDLQQVVDAGNLWMEGMLDHVFPIIS
ncbi:hypothetical protein D3C71_1901470 [compost metagenome]